MTDISHTHVDERGKLVRCYHTCRDLLTSWKFWAGYLVFDIMKFPLEHGLWDNVWPFRLLTTKWHLG